MIYDRYPHALMTRELFSRHCIQIQEATGKICHLIAGSCPDAAPPETDIEGQLPVQVPDSQGLVSGVSNSRRIAVYEVCDNTGRQRPFCRHVSRLYGQD
jgi:hypothetical protein